MTGKENLVQNVLNDMIERYNPLLEPMERSNPLLELTREPRKMEEKRPVPRRSMHVLFTKKLSKNDRTG